MKRAIEQLASDAVSQLPFGQIKDPTELMKEFSEQFANLIVVQCIELAKNSPENAASVIANHFQIVL
jgi:hypothetical protein